MKRDSPERSDNILTVPDREWSFSSITTYRQCPLSFKLKYVDEHEDIANGFSEFGTLFHEVLENYAKRIITAEDCSAAYNMSFDEAVTAPYPPYPKNMRQRAFHRGERYFNAFAGFGEKYEVVATEQGLYGMIGPHKFRGVVDLVLRDLIDNRLVIIDHKTKSQASMKKEMELFKKQLYLYAHLIITQMKEHPRAIGFNMVDLDEFMLFDFDEAEYAETLKWAEDSIDEILLADEFPPKPDYYFCEHICGVRHVCPA